MGSMLGYWIINLGWRWVFHIIAMVTFVNFIAFVYFTEETHAP
jgi:predicted MFS family arabinose efflux permease